MTLLDIDGGTDDGTGLHNGDLREGDGQTAAAVAHHGVELVQGGDDGLDLGHALAHILGQQLDVGLLSGDELVQRGIRKRMVTGLPSMASWIPSKSPCCMGSSQPRFLTLLHGVGADHLTDGGDAVALEEHMLGAAQADALSTQLTGLGGVVGGVGIGTHPQAAELIGPAHDAAEVAADAGVHGGHSAVVDVAGGAVQTPASHPHDRSCRPA